MRKLWSMISADNQLGTLRESGAENRHPGTLSNSCAGSHLGARLSTFVLMLMAILSLSGCVHRDVFEPADMHYVKVYIDETIQNVNTGFYREDAENIPYSFPKLVKVMLCDPSTGDVVASRFLQNQGADPRGNYFDGYIQCRPGKYKMLARSYGSEVTIVENDNNFFNAVAYTNPISFDLASRLPKKAGTDTVRVNMPDHLFVVASDVNIPFSTEADTLRNAVSGLSYFVASTIVESYYIQLKVKGIQYLSSVSSLLAGLSGKARLHDGARMPEPVEIYFDMTEADFVADEATIYATFNTFGKANYKSYDSGIILQFVVITLDGKARTTSIDIAEEFNKPDAIENKWILLNKLITIPPPEGGSGEGGFTPGVEQWTDVTTEIVI